MWKTEKRDLKRVMGFILSVAWAGQLCRLSFWLSSPNVTLCVKNKDGHSENPIETNDINVLISYGNQKQMEEKKD